MSIRDLDLTTLRLFVAACELRNMARAGEQEHIGASAISKRLALLEAQVRAPLLERHRRGVVPTAAGEILLEHARALLATADRVARDMTAYRHGVKGQVRVLASMSSITESLPDDIAAFLARPEHAQIRVDIEERTSSATTSSGVLRRLARLWAWLADSGRIIKSAPPSSACSAPRRLGTSTDANRPGSVLA